MIAFLLACGGPQPELPEPPVGTTYADPVIDGLRAHGLQGYTVQEGRLQSFDEAQCDVLIETLGHCQWNNPATPYVTAFFDEYDAPFGRVDLDPRQAVVFVGRTPPESLYYSLSVAVHERTYPDGVLTPVGSVAASLHHQRIQAAGVFDAPTVVIATADRAVAQQVRRGLEPLLASAGILEDVVNVVEIPFQSEADLQAIAADPAYEDITVTALRMGHEDGADRFSLAWRVAGADPDSDWFDGDRIHQAVFLLTPDDTAPHDPWTYPLLPPLRDSENRPPSDVEASVRLLAETLSQQVEDRGLRSVRLPFDETVFDGFACIENGQLCGNSDDALYLGSVRVQLPEAPVDAGVFVVGVVHPDVAGLGGGGPRLAYSNLNLQNASELRAIGSWLHPALRGTARSRFPGAIAGIPGSVFDVLYVLEFSNHCQHPDCLPLEALGAGDRFNFLERAYLDLGTGTGPHPSTIVEPRLIVYGPTLIPLVLQNTIEVRGP